MQLLESFSQARIEEITTNLLLVVCNILNNVNVSVGVVSSILQDSRPPA